MKVWAGVAVCLAVALLAAPGARATEWTVSCDNGTKGTISNGTSMTDSPTPLGTLLGMPGMPAVPPVATAPGDTITVGGTCTEDVTITTPQLTVAGSTHETATLLGQLEIAGAGSIQLVGLTLGAATIGGGLDIFSSASDQALLYAHDGASVTMQDATVQDSCLFGVLAAQSASVTVLSSTITTNGPDSSCGTVPQVQYAGIHAENGSTVLIDATSVTANRGDGVSLLNGSSLVAQDDASVSNNVGRQIALASGSSAHIAGGTLDGSSCLGICLDTIDILGGSALQLDGGTEVLATTGQNAIFASDGSNLLTSGAFIAASASTPAVPIIDAAGNSVIGLAGGNTICSNSCDTNTTGTAIQVDHVSTLVQIPPAEFGYPEAADAIFGDGTAQLQSTIDLGLGNPGLTWTTPTGSAGISVAQNSSLRLEGGVDIVGKVSLSQGSNGFFNTGSGGTNTITLGVTCTFTFIPASHIVGVSSVSPPLEASANFLNPGAGVCLDF